MGSIPLPLPTLLFSARRARPCESQRRRFVLRNLNAVRDFVQYARKRVVREAAPLPRRGFTEKLLDGSGFYWTGLCDDLQ